MGDLKRQIQEDVKTAMRGKEKERLAALRLVTAAVKQREVDERIDLDDAGVVSVLDRMAKQHRDSIEQYERAKRRDLVEKEQFELDIILHYLPAPLDENEVSALVDEAVAATGAASMKDMGSVMGRLKPVVQGRADLGKVSALVKDRLG